MRAFLTGGEAFVGAHVARALGEVGVEARCWVEPGAARRGLAGLEVERVEGSIFDREALAAAMAGTDLVFHCAEDYRSWAPDLSEIRRFNVEGTRTVLAAAARAGVERVVHMSSVGALGRLPGAGVADEETPVGPGDPVGPYQRSKYRAERVVEEHVRGGLDVVIVNPPASVGELDFQPTPVGKLVLDFLRGDLPGYMDAGRNFVDVRDVARGHLLAAEQGVAGERYVLGGENLSVAAFLELLSRVTGRPAPTREFPQWAALAYAAASEGWARITGGEPALPLDGVRASRQKLFVRWDRAARDLGYEPGPLEAAVERAVAWFRRNGYVDGERGHLGRGRGG